MSDRPGLDKQAAIDAVVSGDVGSLEAALLRMTDSDAPGFLFITGLLLETKQREQYSSLGYSGCILGLPPFYFEGGVVYGAVYTDGPFLLTKNAHRSGIGIACEVAREVVLRVRAQYDDGVQRKAQQLKDAVDDLYKRLAGHSFADSKLTSLAHADLFKGQALLMAALNPVGR